MRILIASDAWFPQINGVVRTLATVVSELEAMGHEVLVVHPGLFRSVPCPTYREIRLAVLPGRKLRRLAQDFGPQALHIATEGPIGLAARSLCSALDWPFTTSFHTRFPEYIYKRLRLPTSVTYRGMRWFHGGAQRVMVATASVEDELRARGFDNTVRWSRGVDTELFRPREGDFYDLPRPIHLYVGRVAVEKNIEAFLKLELEGSQVVVGDGPQLQELQKRFPRAHFCGKKEGEALAQHYAGADVFCFPSRTDTFGLVLLEALASGVPVAAYPVSGPVDVIGKAPVGVLDEDLRKACRAAASLDPSACRDFATKFSWTACARLFFSHLAPFEASLERAC